jgi:FKBP-type peptidyl-prolyl cis-trans isomerase SlpA
MPVFVREDSYVTLHYRITLDSGPGAGQVFADTFTGRPATLQLGTGQWAPNMEAQLVGHAEGTAFSSRWRRPTLMAIAIPSCCSA